MATEVVATPEFEEWYVELSKKEQDAVDRYVGLLEAKGVTLGHPYSSALNGTKLPLRELRVQAGGQPLRPIYAFDLERNAVLLIGGNKTGDDRFYERIIPEAERIWREYLAGKTDAKKEGR
jgi:hypothetical protein